jgi:hypothetical protein
VRSLVPATLAVFVGALGATSCAARPAQQPEAPAPPPARGPTAQVVNATILANRCQQLGRANAQLAERAMYDLVEGCAAVPGGTAQFEATLEPGGRVAISGVPGHPDVVPICVLKHALVHKVPLAKPCQLDVRLEQTAVAIDRGDAGAGGADGAK